MCWGLPLAVLQALDAWATVLEEALELENAGHQQLGQVAAPLMERAKHLVAAPFLAATFDSEACLVLLTSLTKTRLEEPCLAEAPSLEGPLMEVPSWVDVP